METAPAPRHHRESELKRRAERGSSQLTSRTSRKNFACRERTAKQGPKQNRSIANSASCTGLGTISCAQCHHRLRLIRFGNPVPTIFSLRLR